MRRGRLLAKWVRMGRGGCYDALSPFCPHNSIGCTAVVGAGYISTYAIIIVIIVIVIYRQRHHRHHRHHHDHHFILIICVMRFNYGEQNDVHWTWRTKWCPLDIVQDFQTGPKWLCLLLWHHHAFVWYPQFCWIAHLLYLLEMPCLSLHFSFIDKCYIMYNVHCTYI